MVTPVSPIEIFTSVSSSLTTLGVLPYVFAGAVIALIGRLILAARKAGK